MGLHEIAQAATSTSQTPVHERDVERLLSAILASDDVWRILDLSDVPVMAACELLQGLHRAGWVEWKDGRVWLTTDGRERCRAHGVSPAVDLRCAHCEGSGVELGPMGVVASAFSKLAADRPEALQEYDQGFVNERSALSRAAFMWNKGDVAGREILVLGDDDLLSVALSLTGASRRVVALDIDPRIVDFLGRIARDRRLPLEVVHHDLRYPLPRELSGAFDTFVCDPTESLRGFLAFAWRGMSALRGPGCAGYLGLTRREASLTKWRHIQQALLESGAVITDLHDDFHAYENWSYFESMVAWDKLPTRRVPERDEAWYRSALIRLELLEQPRCPQEELAGDMFDDAEAATS